MNTFWKNGTSKKKSCGETADYKQKFGNSYSIDSNGTVSVTSGTEKSCANFKKGDIYYYVADGGKVLRKIEITTSSWFANWNPLRPYEWTETETEYKVVKKYSYSKGSYINRITSTSKNSYPNGTYSGNYWYVYQGVT